MRNTAGALPAALFASLILVFAETGCRLPGPLDDDWPAEGDVHPEWNAFFEDFHVDGAFALYDARQDRMLRCNPELCARRFLPASTFKILNALIALETGVIPGADYVITWNGDRYPVAAWNQDHSLRSAMRDSVVWYFQEAARRAGRSTLQRYVDAAGYGNRDCSGAIDTFWLDGGLRISADEQVDFLRRLYHDELPFSPHALRIVREILVLEETAEYTLSGKTGWAQGICPQTGWFIGRLERDGREFFFAALIRANTPNASFGRARLEITRAILREMRLLA